MEKKIKLMLKRKKKKRCLQSIKASFLLSFYLSLQILHSQPFCHALSELLAGRQAVGIPPPWAACPPAASSPSPRMVGFWKLPLAG